jgi:hypothetical protein
MRKISLAFLLGAVGFFPAIASGQLHVERQARVGALSTAFESSVTGTYARTRQKTGPALGAFDLPFFGTGPDDEPHEGSATPTIRYASTLADSQRELHASATIDSNADAGNAQTPLTVISRSDALFDVTFTVARPFKADVTADLAYTGRFGGASALLYACPAVDSDLAKCDVLMNDLDRGTEFQVLTLKPGTFYRLIASAGGTDRGANFDEGGGDPVPFSASSASFDVRLRTTTF